MFDRRWYRFQKLFVTRLVTQGAEVSVLDLWSLMTVAGRARDYRDNQRTGKKKQEKRTSPPHQNKKPHTHTQHRWQMLYASQTFDEAQTVKN